jgi:putative selenium metabolism protein SsnA
VQCQVITNALVYTGGEVLPGATVTIEGDRIASVQAGGSAGPAAGERGAGIATPAGDVPDATIRIDARGRLVTPGLVNAHTHAYAALARGITLADPAPDSFVHILERLWWRLDRALTLEDIDLCARLHGLECLRAGVTAICDHHASQRAIVGSLAVLAKAFGDVGLRACLCFEVSDREGPAAAAAGIRENLDFIRATASADPTRRQARFGLHASLTLSDETLSACTREPEALAAGFHVHVAEDAADQGDAQRRGACSVVDRLDQAGVLTPRTICVHGIHLGATEMHILAGSRAWLVHCPQSNMNNAVGTAALGRLRAAGVRLALGTDGFTASVIREALVAHLLHNHAAGDPRAGFTVVPQLLFGADADLAAETFGADLGHIRPGSPADLVLWDYLPPMPLSVENIWGHVMFGLTDARAGEVWIAGRHVLSDGRPVGWDEEDLISRCRAAAQRLWERF